MKPRRHRASRAQKVALAALSALLLAGCGEIKNTVTAPPSSANTITVALPGRPNALYVGLYEAESLGLFQQTDLNVRLVVPTAGADPVTMVHDNQVLVGLSSEPNVLLHRNLDQPVVAVGAIVHGPLPSIAITVPKAGPTGGAPVTTSTTTTTKRSRPQRTRTRTTQTRTTIVPTTTTIAEPDSRLWPGRLQQLLRAPGHPTYDGLVIVARKDTIVNDAPVLRRFVQALARGYRAARANPAQAIDNLITAVPALAPQKQLEAATLKAAMPYLFPAGLKVWGWQKVEEWNSFGTWMTQHHLLSNPMAITDASTNELLAGQGV